MDTLIFKFLDKSSFFSKYPAFTYFYQNFPRFQKVPLKLRTKQHNIYMVNAAKAVQLINLTKLLSTGRWLNSIPLKLLKIIYSCQKMAKVCKICRRGWRLIFYSKHSISRFFSPSHSISGSFVLLTMFGSMSSIS